MRRSLLVKGIVTGFLTVGLIVPLTAIFGLVRSRQAASRSVLADVQQASVGPQTLIGPILVVPFRRSVETEITDPHTRQRTVVTRLEEGREIFLPEVLATDVRVGTEVRYRGIYSALLYDAEHRITGSFAVPERFGFTEAASAALTFSEAYVILGISDTRGIRSAPALTWDGAPLEWKSGTGVSGLPSGVQAPVGRLTPGQSHSFAVDLVLQGTEALAYVPVGKATTVAMRSAWPHPSFDGQFLPESRTITPQGFEARWRTIHLASNVEPELRERLADDRHGSLNTLGVSFIEPVNVYLQTERAVKYGFLFVVLTFVVFLLFELLKELTIHPVQYGLVGIGLVLFFLLLLALSEHVPFALAYAVASASCIGLLAFYVSFVLGSVRRAGSFTGMLAALYGSLYVLLRSEDLALLLGAVLLFGILAAIMVATRHVDWYRVGREQLVAGSASVEPSS
jgi:inner membrane protein